MDIIQELNAIDGVSRAIDRIKGVGRRLEYTLSNGIVLSAKPVPPYLVAAVNQEFQPPPPPKVYIEEKGRDEENPNDPQYLRDCQRLSEEQNQAINDLLMGMGTEVVSVPKGYYRPEDDAWISQVEFAMNVTGRRLKVERDDAIKRYLCWLRFYALENGSDIAIVSNLPLHLSGIREEEVAAVMDSFRGLSERGTDPGSSSEESSENGNTANRASRRASARNRGA